MDVKDDTRGSGFKGEGHNVQIAAAVRFTVSLPKDRNSCSTLLLRGILSGLSKVKEEDEECNIGVYFRFKVYVFHLMNKILAKCSISAFQYANSNAEIG